MNQTTKEKQYLKIADMRFFLFFSTNHFIYVIFLLDGKFNRYFFSLSLIKGGFL